MASSESSSSSDDDSLFSDSNTDGSYGGPFDPHPYLFRLLREADWSEVLSRIRSHPHDAQYGGHGSDRMSALHVAVGDGPSPPPVEVIRALIEAGGRDLVLERSATGATALHLAVSRAVGDPAMNDVMRALISEADDSPGGGGGAAAAGAGSYRPTGERRSILAEIETRDGLTPLGVFRAVWIDYASSAGGGAALDRALEGEASSPADLTGRLRVLWDRADILLRATMGEGAPTTSGNRDRFMLHRAVSSPVSLPPSFVKLAIRLCSDQGWERDRYGRVPLAAAAMSPGSTYGCSRHEWLYPINALTETCPSSASMADSNGRLPLHLALDSGYRSWDTGIETILLDAPRALATRDVTTHMYPFMMAAVDTKADLTTVFLLLRQNPTLAWGLAADSLWVKTTKLRDEVKRLEGENAELRDEVSEHVSENRRLRLEVERLKSQIASMETGSQIVHEDACSTDGKSCDEKVSMEEHSSDLQCQNRHVAFKRRRR